MDDKDQKDEQMPVIMIRDRRNNRQGELSSADIMRILRRRGSKGGNTTGGSDSRG